MLHFLYKVKRCVFVLTTNCQPLLLCAGLELVICRNSLILKMSLAQCHLTDMSTQDHAVLHFRLFLENFMCCFHTYVLYG
jgi:hypothetical protein